MQGNRGGARFLLATSAFAIAASLTITAAAASETQTYTYDALGRLVSVQYSGTVNSGQAHSLCYDPAGNRTIYKSSSAGALASCSSGPVPPPPPPPPPPSGNQPPVTVADSLSIPNCGTGDVNVTANDSDPEGNYPLAVVSVTNGARGRAAVLNSTTIEYTSTGRSGADSVTYTVQDSLGATATGVVNITIRTGICQ